MKASGIITVLGGVGAMVLLGLMVVMRGDSPEPVRSPISEFRPGAPLSPSAEGTDRGRALTPSQAPGTVPARPGVAPLPSAGATQPGLPSVTSPSGGGEASARAQAGAVGEAGSVAEAGEAGEVDEAGAPGPAVAAGQVSEVEKVLDVARRAPREDDRINALRWLGENGAPLHFDAMVDIQINDPSPEVRKAAELAVDTLRTKRAKDPWPGVTPKADPQDYMRGTASPSP